MRVVLLALALAAAPAFAETNGQDDHVAEVAGLRVLHVWTAATPAGSDALIYLDAENGSDTDALLTGATALDEKLALVGFTYGAAGAAWTVLPNLPVPAGGALRLEPQVLALRWSAVPVDLVAGAELVIAVELGGQRVLAGVEIGPADATAHSHAGHGH